jgi:hypothetical protein
MTQEQYKKEIEFSLEALHTQAEAHGFKYSGSRIEKGMQWLSWSRSRGIIEHQIRLSFPLYESLGIRWEAVEDFFVFVQKTNGHSITVDFASLGEMSNKLYGFRSFLKLSKRAIRNSFKNIYSDVEGELKWFDRYANCDLAIESLMKDGTNVTGGVLGRDHPIALCFQRGRNE